MNQNKKVTKSDSKQAKQPKQAVSQKRDAEVEEEDEEDSFGELVSEAAPFVAAGAAALGAVSGLAYLLLKYKHRLTKGQ